MNIALAGFGQEGRASYDYWNVDGNQLTIADERQILDGLPEGVPTILGDDAFTKLGEFDRIIRSPSINPSKLPYGDKVWSATNEFFAKCPSSSIIGVTGTKGKGTTTSLIAAMLRACGKNVHLLGNIGVPALSKLSEVQPDDFVVFELSSFQLWDLKKSPHTAVVLMIEPDHLDVHNGMQDYIDAKANITKYQTGTDVLVFNQANDAACEIAKNSHARLLPYPSDEDLSQFVPSLQLPGAHNLQNVSAAIVVARDQEINDQCIHSGLQSFSGLPHRLKFVREVSGVKYYDDSIATTPGSAIAALHTFVQPKVLILGGQDKGASYEELLTMCKETNTKVVAIGTNGDTIAELSSQIGVTCVREAGGMPAIVAKAHEVAQPGDVVILSPASASFDMFTSYSDRGEQFIVAVEAL